METHLRTLQKKRTANFREDETKLLIQLWGSPSVQNKLFLTHRKAPVMRLLAANMQQHGFYRTPDEIKTRIRNLKCLYHRIKRSMACGAGFGTVDPDWPHFKSMDDILSKEYPRKETSRIMEDILGGPNTNNTAATNANSLLDISIKEEIEDVDDDNDSWATNESLNSEYEDEPAPVPPPLKPAPTFQNATHPPQQPHTPTTTAKKTIYVTHPNNKLITQPTTISSKKLQTILPAFSLPTTQTTNNSTTAKPGSIPFPLLILNGLQPQQGTDKTQPASVLTQNNLANQQQKNNNVANKGLQFCFVKPEHKPVQPGQVGSNGLKLCFINKDAKNANKENKPCDEDVPNLLKELIDMQKENLEVQRQKLDVEKQRLEFDRLIGTQLVTIIPMLGGIMQKLTSGGDDDNRKRKLSADDDVDIMRDCKILKTMLEKGIKKYMMIEGDDKESDNDDSGIQNDTQSVKSDKSDRSYKSDK